jgi:hypothetical protein
MGRNKEIRKKIDGHRRRVREHRAKVEEEQRRPDPDYGLIANWERRIRIVETEILRLEERLRRH